MVQVWRSYLTDLGRAYPMYALSARQVNDISSNINFLDLLPPAILNGLLDVNHPCGVGGLTPRYLILYTNDGAQFRVSYPQPFSQNLYDYLTLNLEVTAFEFVGERIKYGRLKRLLENV